MSTFLWSQGHLGWSFFTIILFSLTSLVIADLVWRLVRTPLWKLVLASSVIWLCGVILIIELSL